jgi:hypothetical protein
MVLVDKLLPKLKEAGRRVLIFSQVCTGCYLLYGSLVCCYLKHSYLLIESSYREAVFNCLFSFALFNTQDANINAKVQYLYVVFAMWISRITINLS